MLGRFRPFAELGSVLVGQAGVGVVVVVVADAGSYDVESVVSEQDMGLAPLLLDLGHRPCRLVHRTPVLYSRNQSRTNIALCKEKGKEGAGQLAELLNMILEWARRVVRGSYRSAPRTTCPAASLSFLSQRNSHSSSIHQ
jgi:hypothetical protein